MAVEMVVDLEWARLPACASVLELELVFVR